MQGQWDAVQYRVRTQSPLAGQARVYARTTCRPGRCLTQPVTASAQPATTSAPAAAPSAGGDGEGGTGARGASSVSMASGLTHARLMSARCTGLRRSGAGSCSARSPPATASAAHSLRRGEGRAVGQLDVGEAGAD
jgi:hypothetical protein